MGVTNTSIIFSCTAPFLCKKQTESSIEGPKTAAIRLVLVPFPQKTRGECGEKE